VLAYAFILTHEGYPCVFWQDYFNWDLASQTITAASTRSSKFMSNTLVVRHKCYT